MSYPELPISPDANACLVLADGKVFFGKTFGANTIGIGEICFNTGMTGYQETLTDLSFFQQIITFTFPHIGNVGCNDEDMESLRPGASGLVLRELPTLASNFRSQHPLAGWLVKNNIPAIAEVDTRALTRYIRKNGAQNAMIVTRELWLVNRDKLLEQLRNHPSMEGLDLAHKVTTQQPYGWHEKLWKLSPTTNHESQSTNFHVVAIDYGEKLNILRSLAERDCKVTVVPAKMSAEEILALKPDGIFLSNGPGDPAATGIYAIPILQKLIASNIPIFGICLGHQLLGLALGGKTGKLKQGHRGANQPVKNLDTHAVEITSQNHGFAVVAASLPENVHITHISLFDDTVQGLRCTGKPIFAVQYHPESSPGPHDSQYLFDNFITMMKKKYA